jgi:hypothetical protein
MKTLNFLLRSDITDIDVLNNISDNTDAVLIDDDNCWIEISENGFFVPDGWAGTETKNILEAQNALIKFKIENEIF